MSRPLSAVLRLETIEQRLCPAGLDPNTPFINIIQNEPAEATKLVQQILAGQAAADAYVNQVGNDPLTRVVAEYQFVVQLANNGVLAGIEHQLSVTAQNYYQNPTSANLNSMNLALESAAFALGALNELTYNYETDALNAKDTLNSYGPNGLSAVYQNALTVQNAADYIFNTIQQQSIGSAVAAFRMPVLPSTIDPNAFNNTSGSGAFDPDNDGDDDTGMAGY